jgi:hypothetical protein
MSDTILQDVFDVSGNVWCVSAVTTSGGSAPSDSNTGTSWQAPFASVHHAAGVAAAGDLILVGAGTFVEGSNPINLPSNVSLFGAGIYSTIIQSSYGTGAAICPGTGSVVQDLTSQVTTTGNYAYPLGAISSASQSVATNCICRRLRLLGDTDGILLSINTSSPPTVQWDLYDIDFATKWDALNASQLHGGSGWSGLVINLYGPRSSTIGPSSVGAGQSTSRGLILAAASGGVLNIFGQSGQGRRGTSYSNNTYSGGASQITALYAGAGATINAYDMTLSVNLNATMATSGVIGLADVLANGSNAVVNLYDCIGSLPNGVPKIAAKSGGQVNVSSRLASAMAYSFPTLMGGGSLHG